MTKILIETNKQTNKSQIIAQTESEERAHEIARDKIKRGGSFTKSKAGDYGNRDRIIGVFDKEDLKQSL